MEHTAHVHLVSDSTGETVNAIARACLAQFTQIHPVEHFWNLVRTERQMAMVLEELQRYPGPVLFTLLNPQLRRMLEERCRELGLSAVAILDPVFGAFSRHFGMEGTAEPGRQHALDTEYFQRMEAMDFAIGHDDGQTHWNLEKADVVLVGVSRTSKTPTCLYLANRGIKAANVPFVPSAPLPEMLLNLPDGVLVVGLTNDPARLVDIRRTRLRALNAGDETAYVDIEEVREEVAQARKLFNRMRWPVIDVTRRSIEETAAEIIKILVRRRGAAQPGGETGAALPNRDMAS